MFKKQILIEVLHGGHAACQEQYNIIPMGQNVLSNAKHFYCSCHATWPPCKTSICSLYPLYAGNVSILSLLGGINLKEVKVQHTSVDLKDLKDEMGQLVKAVGKLEEKVTVISSGAPNGSFRWNICLEDL